MKLGFYSSNWTMPWGASEELWSQAAQLLQEQGHSVVVNYKWWPNCPERLAEIQHAGGFVFWRGQSQVKDSRSNESWLEKVEPEFVLILPLLKRVWSDKSLTQLTSALPTKLTGLRMTI
jgi:hypothetical protein